MKGIYLFAAVIGFAILAYGEQTCRGNSCGECLSSGTSCGWCADNSFNTKDHSRCQNFRNPVFKNHCSKNGVIQPVSRLTKIKASQLSDKNMLGREKMWISLRKDGEETIRIDSRVPNTAARKKTNVLLKLSLPKDAPLNFTLDADCNLKRIVGKSKNKLICKKQRRRSEIIFKVNLHLRECIQRKGKTKVKLIMKVGKQKEVAHIYVSDLCQCKCVQKNNAKKCKFNGKKAVGHCHCGNKSLRPTKPDNTNPPIFGAGLFQPARAGGNDGSKSPIVDDWMLKLPAGTRPAQIECNDCKERCADYGECVNCFAFSGSPMPNAMCGHLCGEGRNRPRMIYVSQFPDETNVCQYKDSENCLIKYQMLYDKIFEVKMPKECPKTKCPSNATCPVDKNGMVCSSHGVCDCGVCKCGPGFSGDVCEKCDSCHGRCLELKDCAACVSFEDYGGKYKTKEQCLDNCKKYAITRVDIFTGTILPQQRCQFYDSQSCVFNFVYHGLATEEPVINVLSQRACPDGLFQGK